MLFFAKERVPKYLYVIYIGRYNDYATYSNRRYDTGLKESLVDGCSTKSLAFK